MKRRHRHAAAALVLLAIGSCRQADAPQPEPVTAPRTAPAEVFAGTVGTLHVRRDSQPVATLIDVRTARHDDFDRVVFEFRGPVPGYRAEYVDRPVRKCGSGEVTAIRGDGWLELRMEPAAAHDDEGRATITARESALALPVLRELELTCDYEAVLTWVLGVTSPNAYRVQELSDPPRLVVDVRHR